MRFEMFRARSGGMGDGNLTEKKFPKPEGWTPRIIKSDINGVRSKDGGHIAPADQTEQSTQQPEPTKPPTNTPGV